MHAQDVLLQVIAGVDVGEDEQQLILVIWTTVQGIIPNFAKDYLQALYIFHSRCESVIKRCVHR